jgi:hypothetical protein
MRRAFLILLITSSTAWFERAAAADFEMSDDGLYRRESSVFNQLWVRKDFDARSYHKVMFAPSIIEYRSLAHHAATDPNAPPASPLTTRQMESLQAIFDTAFREELAKSRYFALTTQPGSDVLKVRGNLRDVVSYVPANASGKDDPLTVPKVGEAILGLELFDSVTPVILVRASDHVVAQHADDTMTAEQAVRASALAWAKIFRERLDAAASIPPEKE